MSVTIAARRSRLAPLFLLAGLCLFLSVPSAAAAPKNVLILSEGPVLPYGAVLRATIIETLRRNDAPPLNVYEELIDRIRLDSAAYDRQLVTLYNAKYINEPPDLIIAITEPALDFALRHRQELFPKAALLFGAVDERAVSDRKLGADATGVFNPLDAGKTLEVALRFHPATRHILVIGGTSRLDRGYMNVVQEDLSALAFPAAITYITNKPLRDVIAAVTALGDDGLVLFVSMQSDGEGVVRSGAEVLEALRRTATAPIYGTSKNVLGHGIVGGVLMDMERHGLDLGQRAREILAGARAADLAPMTSANLVAFDWRELRRFGVTESRLPVGATIVNREPGLWQTYKWTLLAVGTLLVGQFVLIGGLWAQGRRRSHAELALRTLSGRLLSAQEEERRRIARELHDGLSQQLALLSIEIEQMAAQPVRSTTVLARSMRELGERAAEISTEIHNMSHRLHSSKLDALGLAAAVRGHCREVLAQGLQVDFSEAGVPTSISHDVQLCLFRIVQEGLNNVVKHSGAGQARVTLVGTGEALVLSVADFGRGFNEADAAARDGLGLASMRERLRLVGGELTISSRSGQGTTLEARVPLTSPRGQSAFARSERVA